MSTRGNVGKNNKPNFFCGLYSDEPWAFDQSEHMLSPINIIYIFSIITQVIIEILALSLAENSVIFRYNHLRRGDYSGRTNFQNNRLALCQCVLRVH